MTSAVPRRGAGELEKLAGAPLEVDLVLIKDVAARLGLRSKRVLIWARRGENGAPAPIRLSDRIYAMHRHEADAWVAGIIQAQDGGANGSPAQ